MDFRFLRYLAVLVVPFLTVISFISVGWLTFSTVIFAYLIVPALEFLFERDNRNLDDELESKFINDPKFDYVVYLMVPIQYALLSYYLYCADFTSFGSLEFVGRTVSMGVCCGVIGINVAHELGHRNSPLDRFLAKALLLSSLYMHFIIEHNRGHHKHVATPLDPATSRKGESLHKFWFRSGLMSFYSAWKLEFQRLDRKKIPLVSFQNEMIRFLVLQAFALFGVFTLFGWQSLVGFLIASVVGILQLETVNYIEHYGLQRKQRTQNRYERVQPWHSWNSDHIVGRLLLFELSRHSDHHYLASRKYQILRHHKDSPQMPTGYPGMMLLSLFPPLWFWVMDKKLDKIARMNG